MVTFSELKYEAVIVQVAADFRRIDQLLHAGAVKLLFSPDSGQHEELRSTKGAATNDDFFSCADALFVQKLIIIEIWLKLNVRTKK